MRQFNFLNISEKVSKELMFSMLYNILIFGVRAKDCLMFLKII